MRRLVFRLAGALVVALALCAISALQARAIVALVAAAVGSPVPRASPVPMGACVEPSRPSAPDALEVARALGAGSEREPARNVRTARAVVARPPSEAPPAPGAPGLGVFRTPDGIVLGGVRPGTLPELIGLRDGDVVKRVNGIPAERPEAGILAFRRLRGGGDIRLDIERAGWPVSILYHVR